MGDKSRLTSELKAMWLTRRWLILAMIAFFSFLFELYELSFHSPDVSDPLQLLEFTVHGVILPIVLITLHRTEAQKNNAINMLALHDSLENQLNNARNWRELIEIIAQFPRIILPLAGVRLFIRLPNSNKFNLELERDFETGIQKAESSDPVELKDAECAPMAIKGCSGIRPCSCQFQSLDRENKTLRRRYCLPLLNADSTVGLLHLELPASYRLMPDQIGFLNSIVPEIVTSLVKALLQRKTLLQEAAIETERLRLASDLHDTLGQDLAYLRNKLDQLIYDKAFRRVTLVKQELSLMRHVAEEANQTVRNILAVTHPKQEAGFHARLLNYGREIGERAHFIISLESQGQPYTLSPHMQFQIFLIFREILANIEKHANAHHVTIALTWSERELRMAISDDGCGFLKDRIDNNDHFGLTIIETRTREMNGQMSVISAPNEGTKVSICLPTNHDASYSSN